MTTYFLDPSGGLDANNGTTFALRKRSLGSFTLAGNDIVRVIRSPAATSLGVTGIWTNSSSTVTLGSAVNTTITNCDSNWTAATNVTCTLNSSAFRQGSNSESVAIAAGFTTGKAAHFATGTLDLSAYEQISFWIRVDASVSANVLRVSLCSDTTGDTQVDNFDINIAISNTSFWYPITLNKGSALGSSIQSIALYAQSDPGTVTVLLDNIFAVKSTSSADSLNLNSLLGKNTSTETWWAIRSITGATVILDQNPRMSSGGTNRGYFGVSETVTTHKMETIKTDIVAASTTKVQSFPNSGTAGSVITLSGGWNSTDMSTQDGETWLDGRMGFGQGIDSNNKNYLTLEKLGCVRYNANFNFSGTNNIATVLGANNGGDSGAILASGANDCTITVNAAVANTTNGVTYSSSLRPTFPNLKLIYSNTGTGVNCSGAPSYMINTGVIDSCNNNGAGVNITTGGQLGDVTTKSNNGIGFVISSTNKLTTLKSLTSQTNTTYGLEYGTGASEIRIYSLSTTGHSIGAVNYNGGSTVNANYYLFNAVMAEVTKVSNIPSQSDIRVYSHKEGGTTDNHKIYGSGYNIVSETGADRHTASGMAWKINITSTTRTTDNRVRFSVAKFAVSASTLVTFKAWVKRSSNTAINARLLIPGGRIAGVASDVAIDAAAASNTYEELTLTCTPTEAGVIEVFLDTYSGTSTTDSVFIDDLTITQA